MPRLTPQIVARFLSHVDKNGPVMPGMTTPCWVWTASKRGGYGAFKIAGRSYGANRLALEIGGGRPIEAGKCALHRCDVKMCVNYEGRHLFSGTKGDNNRDRAAKGRSAVKARHGSNTHPERRARGARNGATTHPERVARGEEQGLAKMTAAGVVELRKLAALGWALKRISARFSIDPSTAWKIITRKTWRHVT